MTTMQTKVYARDIRHKIAEIKPGGYTGMLGSDLNEMLIEQVERITAGVRADALAVRDEQIERLAKALAEWASGGNYPARIQDAVLRDIYQDRYEMNRDRGFDLAEMVALKAMIKFALEGDDNGCA